MRCASATWASTPSHGMSPPGSGAAAVQWTFSGFGSIGAVHLDSGEADFTSSILKADGAGATHAWCEVFLPGATALIARASHGLTRRINILADKSLLAAYTENGHAVTEREKFGRSLQFGWRGGAAAATGISGLSSHGTGGVFSPNAWRESVTSRLAPTSLSLCLRSAGETTVLHLSVSACDGGSRLTLLHQPLAAAALDLGKPLETLVALESYPPASGKPELLLLLARARQALRISRPPLRPPRDARPRATKA